MNNQKIAGELVKIAKELMSKDIIADLRLSPKDKKVIESFIDEKSNDSKKLYTNGKQLDGLWIGGNNIAYWNRDGKIEFTNLTSRAEQTVQRVIKKMAPRFSLA